MKKIIIFMLAIVMFTGCAKRQKNIENAVSVKGVHKAEEIENGTKNFRNKKNKENEDVSENLDRTQASISLGDNISGMAKRGDNAAIYSPIYSAKDEKRKCVFYEKVLTPGSTKEYSVEGNITNVMLDDNNRSYFIMNDKLYQYTYGGNEECLLTNVSHGKLIGEIGSRVYFQYEGTELDVVTVHLAYYDIETGQKKDIETDDLQGNVESLIGGNHFFYIGGRTDASAKPLYEIDTKSLKVRKIENHVISMSYDEKGNLYYTASESDDYLSNLLIVKKYDTKTGKISKIFQETESEKIGSIVMANNSYLYFQNYDGVETVLSCWNLKQKTFENIKRGTDIKYVPDCEYKNNFYLSKYSKDSEGNIVFSELYKYLGENKEDILRNANDGLGLVANEIEGDIQGVAGNCLFYVGKRGNLTDYRIEGFKVVVND